MSGSHSGDGRGEPGSEEWRFETGNYVRTSPAVADGAVYVGSWDGRLYAIARDSGTEQWRFETERAINASPAVVGGTVYVGSDDGHLYAVDAATGEQQWAVDTGNGVDSAIAVAEGTVYATSGNSSLCAVDAATGTERWTFDTGMGWNRSSPAVADGTVYVGSGDGHLYAVDAATGAERWSFDAGGPVASSPTMADGTVYVGSNDDHLYAVDATTGEQRWAFDTGDHVRHSPAVADDIVCVPSEQAGLYAVDRADGTERWQYNVAVFRSRSSPTVAESVVYAGFSSYLYAIAADDGSERWRFETGHWIEASPTVVDGTVYVGSDDGHLYAVTAGPETGEEPDGARSGSAPPDGPTGPSETAGDTADAVTTSAAPTGTGVEEQDPSPIPSRDAVTSPPRRTGLSHGDLTVVAEVATGGQAAIRKAELPAEKQPPVVVALREPDTSATLTHEAVEEFLAQAETWATIDAREREKQRWAGYEHIVGVVATGDRQPWLAMEYMDGGDLGNLLAEHPDGLPVGQALWYGECVCKGLEIAHNLGRVHLDVKPGNVLLTETDGWPWPKLADWGLARTLAEETGTMEGLSVQYAGPEQFDPDEFGDPDQLTDIYQTGALVYALLTGSPPASGSQFQVMQQVLSEEPVAPPSERRDELSPAIDAAVGLALARDKTERYSSISVFGDALNALRTGGRLPPAVAARLDE